MSFQKRVCHYVNTFVAAASSKLAHLVTITPEVVLGADVLVGVFGPLLTGVLVLLVLDVLPVSIPPDLSVDGGNDDAGDSDAVGASSVHLLPTQLLHGRGQCHPGSLPHANLIYKAADW